jgi:hypothetical protein
MEHLPWRVALQRKELLSKLDPKTFWYNRLKQWLIRLFRL